MKLRQALACELTPIALRLALAVVFLFAGWNKIFVQREYSPDELAILATMGVSGAIRAAKPVGGEAAPAEKKESQAPESSAPGAPLPEPGKQRRGGAALIAAAPAPELPALAETEAAPPAPADMASQPVFDPARFSGPAKLRGLYILAISLRAGAHPAPDASGATGRALWPPAMASGSWPVRWAWAAALTELVGGGLVLIGFLTRFAGLSLAGVMGVAMWLTVVGPSIGADGAFLGFLPRFPTSTTTPELAMAAFQTWQMFFLQWALLMCALGILLSGAGALSLDRFVFGKSKPRPAQAAPAS